MPNQFKLSGGGLPAKRMFCQQSSFMNRTNLFYCGRGRPTCLSNAMRSCSGKLRLGLCIVITYTHLLIKRNRIAFLSLLMLSIPFPAFIGQPHICYPRGRRYSERDFPSSHSSGRPAVPEHHHREHCCTLFAGLLIQEDRPLLASQS